MNIVLIGYRGAGKSTVGRRLAERLGMGFVDIDALIEKRRGTSIREIVESLGWEHFRAIEKAAIQEASQQSGFIIAPGGGAVLDPENVRSLKDKGLIVWLKAEPDILAERMRRDAQTTNSRPTLTGKGALSEIRDVISSREPIYKKTASIEVDTSTLDIEAVVEKILSIFQNRNNIVKRAIAGSPMKGGATWQSPPKAKSLCFIRNDRSLDKKQEK